MRVLILIISLGGLEIKTRGTLKKNVLDTWEYYKIVMILQSNSHFMNI